MAKFPFMSNDEKHFYYFSINATYLKNRNKTNNIIFK